MAMILNQAIVFDDETLVSLEQLVRSGSKLSAGLGENIKSVIRKACSDYRLLKKCLPAKGLTREVIFFLLDPASTTIKGIQTFFEKLLIWVLIIPEAEQQLYQELVLEYYEPRDDWDEEDIAKIRDSLISIVFELQPLPDTKVPMQSHPGYIAWETRMELYGNELAPSTVEDVIPDIKGKVIPDDVFNRYLEEFPMFS